MCKRYGLVFIHKSKLPDNSLFNIKKRGGEVFNFYRYLVPDGTFGGR